MENFEIFDDGDSGKLELPNTNGSEKTTEKEIKLPEKEVTLPENKQEGNNENKNTEKQESEKQEGEKQEGENKQISDEQTSDVTWAIGLVTKDLGIELQSEELKLFDGLLDKGFTEDGTFVNTVKTLSIIQRDRAINNYWDSLPQTVRDYAMYISNGGSVDKFFDVRKENYETLVIDKTNISSQKQLIIDGYTKLNNMSVTEASEVADIIIDKGNGFTKATEIKTKLIAEQKREQAKLEQEQTELFKKQAEQEQLKITELHNKLDKGILVIGDKTFMIPEKDRVILKSAITNAFYDKENKCYYDLNRNPIPPNKAANKKLLSVADVAKLQYGVDGELFNTYFAVFGGMDKLINQKVKAEEVNRLKNLRANPTDNNKAKENKNDNKKELSVIDFNASNIEYNK